jgi:hypothetical protein
MKDQKNIKELSEGTNRLSHIMLIEHTSPPSWSELTKHGSNNAYFEDIVEKIKIFKAVKIENIYQTRTIRTTRMWDFKRKNGYNYL